VRDGLVIGTWKRTIWKNKIVIEPVLFEGTGEIELRDFMKCAKGYADFLGLSLE
jgi:hypothetical protein